MWWKQFVTKKNGLPIHKIQMKKPKIIITTDSSDTGWGISSPIMHTYGFWTEEEKQLSINLQKFHNKGFDRQQNFNQVHHKRRRHSISTPTRLCSEDSGRLQQVQATGHISTYSRDKQHNSRSIVTDKETIIREHNTKEVLQLHPTALGTSHSGHVCHPAEHTTTKVLESATRPASRCNRCLPTEVDTNRNVCISTMETNTDSTTPSQTEEDQAVGTGDTLVAHPVLVPDAVRDAPTQQANILSLNRKITLVAWQLSGESMRKQGYQKRQWTF
ncbi:hypothetical protein [Parasitella parasitica]|uniref:Uncharacterized protein n=1 Tax=Parasitella parasitica TaxID=35722 RepID=A0A0B7MRA1_9FUNG|nr:hypothetical protein [Parasitella parasitica]